MKKDEEMKDRAELLEGIVGLVCLGGPLILAILSIVGVLFFSISLGYPLVFTAVFYICSAYTVIQWMKSGVTETAPNNSIGYQVAAVAFSFTIGNGSILGILMGILGSILLGATGVSKFKYSKAKNLINYIPEVNAEARVHLFDEGMLNEVRLKTVIKYFFSDLDVLVQHAEFAKLAEVYSSVTSHLTSVVSSGDENKIIGVNAILNAHWGDLTNFAEVFRMDYSEEVLTGDSDELGRLIAFVSQVNKDIVNLVNFVDKEREATNLLIENKKKEEAIISIKSRLNWLPDKKNK